MTTRRRIAALADVEDGGMKRVEVDGVEVLLTRFGDAVFALGARCVHYGAPLDQGVLSDGRIVCPWHHAGFDARTGRQIEPPGCGDLRRFEVAVEDGTVMLTPPETVEDHEEPETAAPDPRADPRVFVVVGAGAAGTAAAEALRAEGFRGRVVLITAEDRLPYDRTLLSKERLSGAELPTALELHPEAFFARHGIELALGREVVRLDPARRELRFADGGVMTFDACLLAAGGRARRPSVDGADLDGVFTLRGRDDAERVLAAVDDARRAVVMGGGFIAMECAASLTARGLAVTVVAPEEVPFAGLFGERVGRALLRTHEAAGTTFRLGRKVARFEGTTRVEAAVTDDGERLPADLVIIGSGIEPATGMLVGLTLDEDGGVPVDAGMRAADGLYAAGDVARFPTPRGGEPARIEHWRVACQQGRVAGRNMAGRATLYDGVPFFWSAQHRALYLVGHTAGFDDVIHDGAPEDGPFIAYYARNGQVVAALGAERNAEMAAIEELMRLGRMPGAAEVEGGRFDPVARLKTGVV